MQILGKITPDTLNKIKERGYSPHKAHHLIAHEAQRRYPQFQSIHINPDYCGGFDVIGLHDSPQYHTGY
jgi:hypothetical protein